MSSRKGLGQTSAASNSSVKGKNVSQASGYGADQLGQDVAAINLSSANDGKWEVCSRKSKSKPGTAVTKSGTTLNPYATAWGHQDTAQKLGMRTHGGPGKDPVSSWPAQGGDHKVPAAKWNARPESSYVAPLQTNAVRPPLKNGWNWKSRSGSTPSIGSQEPENNVNSNNGDIEDDNDDGIDGDETDATDDSDFDLLSDDYDSDSSIRSHDTRKNNKWFKKFFETLAAMSNEELADSVRQWHCPACQGGPGAIDWYKGLQPVLTHAKTKGGKRMKLHRELAELLDEELCRRGTSVIPSGEAYGQWNVGVAKDYEILWPPMVVIMNTKLEKDDNDKWKGMGNQELLDYFSDYAASKARHAYGPQGHRGMSLLIFESTAMGYMEAERLHKHFEDRGTNRDVWNRYPVLFYEGGKRQLYGFMATKKDLELFNQHSHGKMKLKYEMRSHQEMVVNQMKQMKEDNQKLIYLKDKVEKVQRHSKVLEKSFSRLAEKLHKTEDTNRIVRLRTKMQHEQNKEEMDSQEEFFQDQIKIIHEARNAREDNFEMLQQEERDKVKLSNLNPNNTEDNRRRAEEVEKFIKSQEKEMEEFVAEREELVKHYEDKKAEMRQRHMKEEVELETQFDVNLNKLMDKYAPHHQIVK